MSKLVNRNELKNKIMINEEDLDRLFGFPSEELKSYYEYNREDPYSIYIDEKENAIDSFGTCQYQ
jgi:hypothetical protein